MRNKIKFNLTRIIIFTLFICYSCSPEENAILETEESIEIPTLTPKTLATISLPSGTTIIFKTEVDGIVFEASGDSDNFGELDGLNDLSLLDRFLTLTDKSIAVPADLIKLEEDQKIKEKALQRGTIEKHSVNLTASKSFLNRTTKDYLVLCNYPSQRTPLEGNDFYKEIFVNHNSPVLISSADKSTGHDNCRRVEFSITNCSYNLNIYLKHYYSSSFAGNNMLISNTTIPKRKHKYYAKTFFAKRYRQKIRVTNLIRPSNISFSGGITFSGYSDFNITDYR
ncbi:hypothetical protein [Aquimarina megaterium]|uniref:hypothetical protein n=1 Tax=Aquimarina megaterium TaxID=1443666 RepID=UPI0009439FCF|nr:hypothetical protein [Aquimarina megaterium]